MAKKENANLDPSLIDVGDIPMPEAVSTADEIKDDFEYDTAFNFAFIGVGQGGGRLAEQFHKIGYRRVCVLNTTLQDMEPLQLPAHSKLDLRTGGAGKDPSIAEAGIHGKEEEIYDLLRRNWGNDIDYAMICIGAGGGTGAGGFAKVVQVVRKMMEDLKRPIRIGVIVALPKTEEGQKTARNALYACQKIKESNVSPVVIIDNEKIKSIYPKTPVNQFWITANQGVCTLLHLFNRIASQDSPHTVFDRTEFSQLLDSGAVAFGATVVQKYQTPSDISQAIRQQLEANILASVDLKKGTKAGCIFIGGSVVFDEIPMSHLDHGFDMLNRILADGSVVHRGVYPGSKPDLRAYTMIGGLPLPEARLLDLAKVAGIPPATVRAWL